MPTDCRCAVQPSLTYPAKRPAATAATIRDTMQRAGWAVRCPNRPLTGQPGSSAVLVKGPTGAVVFYRPGTGTVQVVVGGGTVSC